MNASLDALRFDRPAELQASRPAEQRATGRGDVRLLVSGRHGHSHHAFAELAELLRPGDLLVVNDSATLAASLPARGPAGWFVLNLSTRFGPRTWLAEPRPSAAVPGPMDIRAGSSATIGNVRLRFTAPHPSLPRLWFVATESALEPVMRRIGLPIRYGYVADAQPLDAYQTMFARVPGSAEMPSAGRPFTVPLVAELATRGVRLVAITLHTGVSSLEFETDLEHAALYAEPFSVAAAAARAANRTRRSGGRVIAVGTTVVRALESVMTVDGLRPARGFTRRFVRPGHFRGSVDGLITGLHDSGTSHLAMLHALAGENALRAAYAEAVSQRYLWHEFGDSHLLFRDSD